MKKIKLLTYTFLAFTGLVFSGCKKDFEEVNQNPNTSPFVTPETLIGPAIHAVVTANLTRALRLNNELMQVHVTTVNSDEIHRYIIRPNESDYMWNNLYLQRTNFLDIYNSGKALGQNIWAGIGLISEVWTISMITDLYGNVPYSEANLGRSEKNFTPKFDDQKDIYLDMFRKLEEANTLLNTTQSLDTTIVSLEPLFNADKLKWRKFGNSLYLRLLMRASAKAESNAPAKIKEILETNKANYPVFENTAESAIMRFSTAIPYVSAFNTYRDFDFNGDNGLAEFFVTNLVSWQDPRIRKWASQVSGSYVGIPSGYAQGNVPTRRSFYLAALKNEPLLGNIMNYAELQFIVAEAAVKGYITGDAQAAYNRGVTSAITMWNEVVPAAYLTDPEIELRASLTFDEKMERILIQKYYTLFFTDFQQWHEYRRTGHPVLPKGPGLQNNGQMPARFKYPVFVQSLNKANYDLAVQAMGPDDLNTKMWWNKP